MKVGLGSTVDKVIATINKLTFFLAHPAFFHNFTKTLGHSLFFLPENRCCQHSVIWNLAKFPNDMKCREVSQYSATADVVLW